MSTRAANAGSVLSRPILTATFAAAVGILSVLGLMIGWAHAGDYHVGDTLVCPECHKNGFRIARQEVNAICLSCHGEATGDAPAVLGQNPSGLPRQAGALSRMGGGLPHFTGHTLGSGAQAPGGRWAAGAGGLTCADCHAAHGEPRQYRNLRLRPGTADTDRRLTYSSGPVNDKTKDVWLRPTTIPAGRYASQQMAFNQPDLRHAAYAAWCEGCHAEFHGAAGSAKMGGMFGGDIGRGWLRHPTVGVGLGARGDRHSSFARYAGLPNRVPTLSPSGSWPHRDNVVSCMSCHKGHGNRNPFGLLYMSGQGQLTEEGDTGGGHYIHLCRQCHSQGLS